jgi:sodium/bile acid cotransporter 7
MVYKDINRVVLVNGLIFIGPLIFVFLFYQIGFFPEYWINGFLFLAILPTTISSCVVYTTAAGGNSDVALGYATASNLLAIFWVPFAWVNLANGSGNEIGEQWISFGVHVLPQIFFLVVLPCLIGWLGCYLFQRIKNIRRALRKLTFILILLLPLSFKHRFTNWRDEFLI